MRAVTSHGPTHQIKAGCKVLARVGDDRAVERVPFILHVLNLRRAWKQSVHGSCHFRGLLPSIGRLCLDTGLCEALL